MTRRLMLTAMLLLTPVALLPNAGRGQTENQTVAQPELPKQDLTIVTKDGVKHLFHVEMAMTPQQQETGLMFRKTVPADGGMLFDWGTPRDSSMWMRNTVSALDMVFIGADGTVRRVVEDTVPESLAIIESHGPVRATLELAAGTAKRLHIHAGDKVESTIFTKG